MGLSLTQVVGALIKGSKWRNASKWKRLISQVKCSLLEKMRRRKAIIRQLQLDVAQLLRIGLHDIASLKVEQLYKDQCMVSAYSQLDQYCDCVCSNLDTISKRRSELSVNVRESVSSLIYAASRCGDVPELQSLRTLFKQNFGQDFERACIELLPGNNVSPQIKQFLSRKIVVPEDVKLQLMNEIAKETTLYLEPAALAENDSRVHELNALDSSLGDAKAKTKLKQCDLEPKEISVSKSHGMQKTSENHKRSNDQKPRVSHVHPKLPDYDDLVVKFTDMKMKNSKRSMLETLMLKSVRTGAR